jgi:chromosome segregation ATPase
VAWLSGGANWSPEKTERLKQLVLRHVSNGGTVLDACEQFEFETNGLHKIKLNQMKWLFSIRHTCKDEYKRAVDLGQRVRLQKFEDQATLVSSDKLSLNDQMDDELSDKLFASVVDIVEHRRELSATIEELTSKLESTEQSLQATEEQRKLMQIQQDKKEQEVDNLQRQLGDNQTKYARLLEDYHQLRATNTREYERVQMQLKESHQKFETLTTDYNRFRTKSRSEMERMENELRQEQIKNRQLVAKFEDLKQDNEKLKTQITDFAHHISSVLENDKPGTGATPIAIPIRQAVNPDNDEPTGDRSNGTHSI